MIKRGEYYFPDYDKDCHSVIMGQSGDIDRVLPYVKNFTTCIQAGGNVGIWPKILSTHFGEVHTFEPDPENYACLLKNLEFVENVVTYNQCLSDKNEAISVSPPDEAHQFNCGALQVVEGGTSAIVIDDLKLDLGLIYLDIEGYELRALQGARQTIEKYRPVIAFEDKPLPFMYGKKVGDVEKWLAHFEYKVAERIHRDVICIPA